MNSSKAYNSVYSKVGGKRSSLTQLAAQSNSVPVFDDDGNDVTPLPLNLNPYQASKKAAKTQDMNASMASYAKVYFILESNLWLCKTS